MRFIQIVAVALVLTGGSALAQACEIEDWRFYELAGHVMIEGATTCKEGKLLIRVYDGETDEYLGNATAYIEGYTFEAIMQGSAPSNLSIKYSID